MVEDSKEIRNSSASFSVIIRTIFFNSSLSVIAVPFNLTVFGSLMHYANICSY